MRRAQMIRLMQADPDELEITTPMPEDGDKPPEQPHTLRDILSQALAKQTSENQVFGLEQDSGLGEAAALARIGLMLGPIRAFCRWVRLEEGMMSLAWLGSQKGLRAQPGKKQRLE